MSRVKIFSESENLNFWQIFEIFPPWPWKKKSTILDGFFPYLAQMITSMRGCVVYNDLWPWPISSRSFGLGLENRVRSVASTVLDGFFPYLVQMITSMRRCVACDDIWPWPISSRSFNLDFENRVWGGGYPRRWHRLIYLVFIGNCVCELHHHLSHFCWDSRTKIFTSIIRQ